MMNAIEKGLAYLNQIQQPSGEFPTITSPRLDLQGGEVYPKSVYLTTFVGHSLSCVPLLATQCEGLLTKAKTFLQEEREVYGAWNYEGLGGQRVPCDMDDTACAVAALHRLGQAPDFKFYQLLYQNEAQPGGPYYTWLGVNQGDSPLARQVDALVNTNILLACAQLGHQPAGIIAYLVEVIETDGYNDKTLYGLSPHFLIYCLTRAYHDGKVTALQPVMNKVRDYILGTFDLNNESPFNLACLVISLFNLGVDEMILPSYWASLLASQQADGGWPARAAWRGWQPNFDGGAALTTSLILESLGKKLELSD